MTPFYIPQLPHDAEYCSREEFINTYGGLGNADRLLNEFQVVDTRLTLEDVKQIEQTPIRPEFASFFEVKDFQEGSKQSNILCGASLFKIDSHVLAPDGKPFDLYLDGLREYVEIFKTFPDQKLRVYVGDNVWDDVHRAGLLKECEVDFVRMNHSSSNSRIGTFWRFLIMDDYDYDRVYIGEIDLSHFEQDADVFHYNLMGYRSSEDLVHLSAELVFLPDERCFIDDAQLTEIPFFTHTTLHHGDPYFIERLSHFNRTAGCYILRGRKRLPFQSIVPFICHHLSLSDQKILYHLDTNRWTMFRELEPYLGSGASGFMNEHLFHYLTKVLTVNFRLSGHRISLLNRIIERYGEDCFLVRLYEQLREEGHFFRYYDTAKQVDTDFDFKKGGL